MIPVAPGAHYSCGGILADLDGRTSLAGLYAVGEAASTGVQGANRLASNSVTEAIIAGRRTGAAVAGAAVARRVVSGRTRPGRVPAPWPAAASAGSAVNRGDVADRHAAGAGHVAVRGGHAGRRRAGAAARVIAATGAPVLARAGRRALEGADEPGMPRP